MRPPSGHTLAQDSTTARLADKGTTSATAIDPAHRRRLIDAGCWVAEQRRTPMRRRRVRDLVDRFLADGRSDLVDERRSVADFRAWFITYSDPTGETAVRNVMRGRS